MGKAIPSLERRRAAARNRTHSNLHGHGMYDRKYRGCREKRILCSARVPEHLANIGEGRKLRRGTVDHVVQHRSHFCAKIDKVVHFFDVCHVAGLKELGLRTAHKVKIERDEQVDQTRPQNHFVKSVISRTCAISLEVVERCAPSIWARFIRKKRATQALMMKNLLLNLVQRPSAPFSSMNTEESL